MGSGREGGFEKNWRSCVLEDAANLTGVNNIDMGIVQALAADRVQWRHMLRSQQDVCDAATPTTGRRPLHVYVLSMKLFSGLYIKS